MTVTLLTSHRKTRPHGARGGEAGAAGRNTLIRADGTTQELSGNDRADVEANDVVMLETPGGGGYLPAKHGTAA